MENNWEIVVGTYEEFLLGYKLVKSDSETQLVQSFATHAHTGSVRAVASSGSYLASGGADDKVIIHDMKTRTESRVLMHHDGTVNCIAFAENGNHILSGGSDGALSITRTGNWQIEKHWPKAHQGSPVTYIAVHPSSKLALTIGEDRTLRTWNLIKGRKAYVINLASKGTGHPLSVVWGPEGQHFSLTGYNDISVWAIANAAVKQILKCPSKAVSMVWLTEQVAAAGLENGEIMLFDLDSGNTSNIQAHSQRVKAITYDNGYLFSGSSSGEIKVWKVKLHKLNLVEKCSTSTGCRITCITLVKPFADVKKEENISAEAEHVVDQGKEEEEVVKKSKKRKNIDPASNSGARNKKSYMPYVSVTLDNDAVDQVGEVPSIVSSKRKKKKKAA